MLLSQLRTSWRNAASSGVSSKSIVPPLGQPAAGRQNGRPDVVGRLQDHDFECHIHVEGLDITVNDVGHHPDTLIEFDDPHRVRREGAKASERFCRMMV